MFIGDTGTTIKITVMDESGKVVTLDGIAQVALYLRSPSGVVGLLEPEVDEQNNHLLYTTNGSEFNEPGIWTLQARVVFQNGNWATSTVRIAVKEPLSNELP